MTEQFNDIGSLYILENQQWKKVGNGTLILMTNPHKPTHIIVKVIDKNGNPSTANTGTVFQCKPKTKPKGNKSYILKGLDTKTHNEYIIAARFKNEDTATCFRIAVGNAAETASENGMVIPSSPIASPMSPNFPNAFSPSAFGSKSVPNTLFIDSPEVSPYQRATMNPAMMRKALGNKPWDCYLCTTHNTEKDMCCRTCNTPRLIMISKNTSTSADDSPPPEEDHDQAALLYLNKMTSHDMNTATIYGDDGSHSPMHGAHDATAVFDWNSPNANLKLSEKPSEEGGDIDSTNDDFKRILRTIESNIVHQDPLKLFDDLQKVAKRLQRKALKYRTLDLKNPVVQERLMKVEGVDAYLKYLGFEEAPNNKLICPQDQPPRSVLCAAQESCKEFLNEWNKKQHIFDLLSESAKNLEKQDVFKLDGHNSEALPDEDDDDDDKKEEERERETKRNIENEQYTLRQLVWSITHESSRDEKQTADVLLLCHCIFAESTDLLRLLVERFHGNTTANGNENTNTLHRDNGKLSESELDKRWNIQIKVGSMLSSWMKTFWEQDFETKAGLMEDLEAFFDSIESAFNEDKRVGVLLKKMQGIYNMQYAKYSEDAEKRVIKHKDVVDMIGKPKNFSMTDQKAVTLAEQFTLMHFKTFKAITKRECLGQSWKKKDSSAHAKNILLMIKLFNQTAKWAQILILTQPTLHKRAKVMKLCIQIATYMKNFRNFSGACAFHSALSSTPIHRLKIAWSKLAASDIKKFKELKKIFGFGTHWMLLRKLHRQAHAPAILHTGLFLSDLVGIDEGHVNHLNGKVNFKKCLKLHEKIDTIAMYQQEQYLFQEDLLMHSLIFEDFKAQEHIDDDFLFKISNSVKASDSKKKY